MLRILKILIALGALFYLLAYSISIAESPAPVLVIEVKNPLTPKELVHEYALEYNVSENAMKSIIGCESGWNVNDHLLTSKEDSWGLSQINLLAHPNISKAQAVDPAFAVEFLAKNLSQGNGDMWYTCWHKYKRLANTTNEVSTK